MKYISTLLVLLFTFPAFANESQSSASSELEKKLSSVEFRTAKLMSGKEKMAKGFADLAPNVREIACRAYPVASDKDIIKSLKKDIASLEKKKTIAQLNAEQVSRLFVQKDIVSKLSPGIDCSALK